VSNFIAFTQLTLLCPCRVGTPACPAPRSHSCHVSTPLPAACASLSPPHNHMCHITVPLPAVCTMSLCPSHLHVPRCCAPLPAAQTSLLPHSQLHVPCRCTSPGCAHHTVRITSLPLRGHKCHIATLFTAAQAMLPHLSQLHTPHSCTSCGHKRHVAVPLLAVLATLPHPFQLHLPYCLLPPEQAAELLLWYMQWSRDLADEMHRRCLIWDKARCTDSSPSSYCPCDCTSEWWCEPHDACFIHDSCFCPGSGSFPPVKPPHS